MIRLASGKRYSKHGSAMVLIIVRLYHLKQKMKIRKPSKNEAPTEIAKFNFQDPGSDSIEPS